MAEAEAHLGRHATDASHRRARLVRAYRLLRRDLVGKDEADVRHRRTPMTMGAAGGSHPALTGREQDIAQVLTDPDEVRRSRLDRSVYLFYRGSGPRWLCAVARREDGSGFLITAYPTDAVKAGESVWTRSK